MVMRLKCVFIVDIVPLINIVIMYLEVGGK